jgi:hypothetical protein
MLLKWWRARQTQEKWMIVLIAALLAGIAVRWSWISSEVTDELRERFPSSTERVDSL